VFIDLTQNHTAAVVVSQLAYWYSIMGKEFYKTVPEIMDECRISKGQWERVSKIVHNLDWLVVEKKGIPAKNYYSFDLELLSETIQNLESGITAHLDSKVATDPGTKVTNTIDYAVDYQKIKKQSSPTLAKPNPVDLQKTSEEKVSWDEELASLSPEGVLEEMAPPVAHVCKTSLKSGASSYLKPSLISVHDLDLELCGLSEPELEPTVASFKAYWSWGMKVHHATPVVAYTQKNLGQMKAIISKAGDNFIPLGNFLLKDWSAVRKEVYLATGSDISPKPQIGTALLYIGNSLSALYLKKVEASKVVVAKPAQVEKQIIDKQPDCEDTVPSNVMTIKELLEFDDDPDAK